MIRVPLCLLALSLLASLPASAKDGGSGSHGGGAVFCPGKEPVILDYYQASRPTGIARQAPALIDLRGKSYEDTIATLRERLAHFPLFARKLNTAPASVADPHRWKDTPLDEHGDTARVYRLEEGCTYRQAAIRQGTRVFADFRVIRELSPAQFALLREHEVYYWASGHDTSEKVRFFMEQQLAASVDLPGLGEAIRALGGSVVTRAQWAPFAPIEEEARRIACDPAPAEGRDWRRFSALQDAIDAELSRYPYGERPYMPHLTHYVLSFDNARAGLSPYPKTLDATCQRYAEKFCARVEDGEYHLEP
jgi:hypothetical protein